MHPNREERIHLLAQIERKRARLKERGDSAPLAHALEEFRLSKASYHRWVQEALRAEPYATPSGPRRRRKPEHVRERVIAEFLQKPNQSIRQLAATVSGNAAGPKGHITDKSAKSILKEENLLNEELRLERLIRMEGDRLISVFNQEQWQFIAERNPAILDGWLRPLQPLDCLVVGTAYLGKTSKAVEVECSFIIDAFSFFVFADLHRRTDKEAAPRLWRRVAAEARNRGRKIQTVIEDEMPAVLVPPFGRFIGGLFARRHNPRAGFAAEFMVALRLFWEKRSDARLGIEALRNDELHLWLKRHNATKRSGFPNFSTSPEEALKAPHVHAGAADLLRRNLTLNLLSSFSEGESWVCHLTPEEAWRAAKSRGKPLANQNNMSGEELLSAHIAQVRRDFGFAVPQADQTD